MGDRSDVHATEPWFHGSPYHLSELTVGSTITQDRDLARIVSHKPSVVSIDEHGVTLHNGRLQGTLYRLAEPVSKDDVIPVPESTTAPGNEWLITRPLRVVRVEETVPAPEDLLTPKEEADLRRRWLQQQPLREQ